MKIVNSQTKPASYFRKNIDLKVNTKHALSIQAIQYGMSLKSYVETMLAGLAEMEEDKLLSILS